MLNCELTRTFITSFHEAAQRRTTIVALPRRRQLLVFLSCESLPESDDGVDSKFKPHDVRALLLAWGAKHASR